MYGPLTFTFGWTWETTTGAGTADTGTMVEAGAAVGAGLLPMMIVVDFSWLPQDALILEKQ